MRRADRLYRITEYLRRRRRTTAAWLAARLDVSERTIYRDVADLVASGVPVTGEAGVGYALHRSLDLPPLMFDRAELAAVELGLRFVAASAGGAMAGAASSAMAKVRAVVPDAVAREAEPRAFVSAGAGRVPAHLEALLTAADTVHRCKITYADAAGRVTTRVIWPLAVIFYHANWTAAAWCERRRAFRNFRADRVRSLEMLDAFPDQDGRRLADYWREVEELYGVGRDAFGVDL